MEGLVVYILIGVTAGILSGLFGIGGGVIIIPALIFLEGFSQLKAQGTSLVALLPPVGILAFFEYYKRGYADLYAGIIICTAMIISAKFGAQLATSLPLDVMRKAFGIFVILVGMKTFLGK
ncbi:MAG: TSUP family transporter [Methanosarcina sp.]|nr:TSUP family transporter [Methanosarcina sp.]MDD3874428.1 TSUP family transporter [Methanosarcina sp.]MDD4523805.1 TSUP family transporter [Methanosarcina sp.]HHV24091.1 sulfite exporter TauE/SafE family protein [Methanosarcina sp.]